jgi:hypothetical protein
MRPHDKPFEEPSKTTAIEGEVVITGPDSVAVSVTPEAAETTAQRLIRTAQVARLQRANKPTASND